MKKMKTLKTLAFFALATTLTLSSCSPATDTPSKLFDAKTPCEAFEHIKISDEIIYSASSTPLSRSVLTRSESQEDEFGTKTKPYPYEITFVNMESRGNIFLYMLKYDLSRLDDFKRSDGFGKTITWNKSMFSDTTKEYITRTQGKKTSQLVIESMSGNIKIDKENSIIKCIQQDTDKNFVHYITLTPNEFESYDIEFYAYEYNFGNMGLPASAYYEFTKITGPSSFEYNRYEANIDSTTTLASLAETDITEIKYFSGAEYSNGIVKIYTSNNGNAMWADLNNNMVIQQQGSSSYSFNINHPDYAETIFLITSPNMSEQPTKWINVQYLDPIDSDVTISNETESLDDSIINGNKSYWWSNSETSWKWNQGNNPAKDISEIINTDKILKKLGKYNSSTEYSLAYYIKEGDFNNKLKIKDTYSNFINSAPLKVSELNTIINNIPENVQPVSNTSSIYSILNKDLNSNE